MKSAIQTRFMALLAGAALFPVGAWALPPLTGQAAPRIEKLKFEPSAAATPDGASALYARLQQAAERVCNDPMAPMSMDLGRNQALCVKAALDEAVASLAIPMVTVVHQYGGSLERPAMARR